MERRKRCWFRDLIRFNFELMEDVFLLFYDIAELLWKLVATVPSVTVVLNPVSLDIGAPLDISGVVNSDVGVLAPAGTPVNVVVTDKTGVALPAVSTTTDEKGAYDVSWVVPTGIAPGDATVTATSLGATGTATFTHNNKKIRK